MVFISKQVSKALVSIFLLCLLIECPSHLVFAENQFHALAPTTKFKSKSKSTDSIPKTIEKGTKVFHHFYGLGKTVNVDPIKNLIDIEFEINRTPFITRLSIKDAALTFIEYVQMPKVDEDVVKKDKVHSRRTEKQEVSAAKATRDRKKNYELLWKDPAINALLHGFGNDLEVRKKEKKIHLLMPSRPYEVFSSISISTGGEDIDEKGAICCNYIVVYDQKNKNAAVILIFRGLTLHFF